MNRRSFASHWQWWLLFAACVATSVPFFTTLRPPLQDLPQHLAAARVLLDTSHEGFRFEEFYATDWFGTQYLGTYLLLGAFFHPLRLLTDQPLLLASRLVLLCLVISWPFAADVLQRRLTRHAGLGAFALALFFNVHLILGFLNFLLGITACLVALAFLATFRSRRKSGERTFPSVLGWSLAALACFAFHIVPFALLLAAAGVLFLVEELGSAGRRPAAGRLAATRSWFSSLAAQPYLGLLPSLLGLGAWLGSPAGVSTREAAGGGGERGRAVYASVAENYDSLPLWLADSFRTPWDTRLFWAAISVLALGLMAELFYRRRPQHAPSPVDAAHPATDRLLLWVLRAFAPLCFLLYFLLPVSYDWIWPINARFPLLGLVFLPLWLPVRDATPVASAWTTIRGAVVVLLALVAGAEAWFATRAFAGFAKEQAGLEEVLSAIPPGKKVASLVFQRGSEFVGFSPFLHVGAHYQAERGGVSFFSFADFPQSPIRFLEGNRPPRVPPRWEWRPERVKWDSDLGWFDFVLVRGGPSRLNRSRSFEQRLEAGDFRLFERRDEEPER